MGTVVAGLVGQDVAVGGVVPGLAVGVGWLVVVVVVVVELGVGADLRWGDLHHWLVPGCGRQGRLSAVVRSGLRRGLKPGVV